LLFALVTGSLFTRWTAGICGACTIIVLFLRATWAGLRLSAIGGLAQLSFLSPSPTGLALAVSTIVSAVGCRARTRPAVAAVLQLTTGQEEVRRSIWEVDGGLVAELGEWDQAIHGVGGHAFDVCARSAAELGGGVSGRLCDGRGQSASVAGLDDLPRVIFFQRGASEGP
jgi:hypothetical protein